VALLNSFKIASSVTVICIVIGSLAAYALVRIPFRFGPQHSTGNNCHAHDPGSFAILPLYIIASAWH